MEGSGSFLRPMIPESWKFFQNQLRSFQEKIYTQIEEDLNNFLSRNMGFQHPKIKKKKNSFVYNDYNIYLAKAKSRRLETETGKLKMALLNISPLKASNINTAHKYMTV